MNANCIEIETPSFGPDEELRLVRWYVADGELVAYEQALCELETKKATMDLYAMSSGVLKRLLCDGELIKPGFPIGTIAPQTDR